MTSFELSFSTHINLFSVQPVFKYETITTEILICIILNTSGNKGLGLSHRHSLLCVTGSGHSYRTYLTCLRGGRSLDAAKQSFH